MPYLGGVLGKEGAQAAAKGFLDRCFEASIEKVKDEDIEEGEDLCNCEFSLAYGAPAFGRCAEAGGSSAGIWDAAC